MTRDGWLLRPAPEPDGLVDYDAANEAMHALAERRLAGDVPDTLVVVEHPPVFTAGRTAKPEHAVWSEARIHEAGGAVRWIDRGGSFTFHGPGQLVGYPIVDLGPRPDVVGYVRALEEIVIRAGADLGLRLHRSEVQTGVWSGDRKVCAIGVRIKRMRVSLHGFAVNCTTDLSWYDAIVPCGLAHTGVTSLSALAGHSITVSDLEPLVVAHMEDLLGVRLRPGPDAESTAFGAIPAGVS
ncbi:MAG: lipoyl(octanoyl) transferase LipB [Actinomycetota bacterium]